MPDMDFTGLGRAAEAAFKPHYADVVRRHARRRRRVQATGALLAVTAVGVGGTLYGLPGGSGAGLDPGSSFTTTPPFASGPEGTPTPTQGQGPAGPMVAGDVDHLYVRWEDCRDRGCVLQVAATGDGGATWRNHALPVGRDALVYLHAAAPRTLVIWSQADQKGDFPPAQGWHASADGGATWREVRPREVTSIPDGWVVLDGFPQVPGILAADPATGDLVTLPARPLQMARTVRGLPPAAGLWVSGYTGTNTSGNGRMTGTGSAVEWSRDGGRTWQRYTFPEPLITEEGEFGSVAIATEDGRTVYAVGQVGGVLRVYRTTDGGKTWAATTARYDVGSRALSAAMGPDGRLMIQARPEGSQPALLLESTDGGATVRALPAGPGGAAVQVPGGYAQTGWPWSSGAWLSDDGVDWRYVEPPKAR